VAAFSLGGSYQDDYNGKSTYHLHAVLEIDRAGTLARRTLRPSRCDLVRRRHVSDLIGDRCSSLSEVGSEAIASATNQRALLDASRTMERR
jgi:hypothetical protein